MYKFVFLLSNCKHNNTSLSLVAGATVTVLHSYDLIALRLVKLKNSLVFFFVFFFLSTSIAIYFFKICFLAVSWGSPRALDASISGVEWSVCPCSLNIVIVVVFQVVNSFLGHVQH